MLHLVPVGHRAELHPYPVLMVTIRKITIMAKTLNSAYANQRQSLFNELAIFM
jgi:hypothetical protein